MPALAMMPVRGTPRSTICWTAARTEARSVSSQAMGVPLTPSSAIACCAFSSVRAVPITWPPRRDKTRVVSRPRPELQPVTSQVVPERSRSE